jgi:hypothetical protein
MQLDATLESFLSILAIFLRGNATDSAGDSVAASQGSFRRALVSQRERHSHRRGQ